MPMETLDVGRGPEDSRAARLWKALSPVVRRWTVVLEEQEQVAAVRERARSAGIATEDHERALLVRDPWEIAVIFVTPEDTAARDGRV